MKAVRTKDEAYIKSVLATMVETCMEDGFKVEDLEGSLKPDVENCYWLDVEGKAVFRLDQDSINSLRGHVYILKEERKNNREIFLAVAEWILSVECPMRYQKLNCWVPVCFPHIKRFLITVGFKEEGVNRFSSFRKGQFIDQWYLGITRLEVSERVELWAENQQKPVIQGQKKEIWLRP